MKLLDGFSRLAFAAALMGGFVCSAVPGKTAQAQETQAVAAQSTAGQTEYQQMIDRAVEFLRTRGQAADGSFTAAAGIGPTALAASSMLSVGVPKDDPAVAKALAFLQKYVQPDGGIYMPESLHKNYDTCIAIMAFDNANADGSYDQLLEKAEAFVKGIQWDEGEGKDPSDMFYGGAGYGSHSRPDLSNTSFLIDALVELGNDEDDEAMQKALVFVSRCQNLESPANNSPFAAVVNDGGFYYTVAGGGETKAETAPNGGLRSYGSMTYAGLKGMIYAGVDKDDQRVKAAVDFLQKHYDLEENPGVGKQGLFYYYNTMAKALDALGSEKFVDAGGVEHNWKAELRTKLAQVQQADGSWVNETTRWMEGNPNLVTSYALLALSRCKP